MLPDRKRQVRVRANFAGDIELRVQPGDRVRRGTALVIIEGEDQIETLSARADAVVVSVHAEDEAAVPAAALLVVLQED